MNATSLAAAAAATAFGDAGCIEVQPLTRRAPAAGEIEVAVHAASLNPIDVRRRGGYGRRMFSLLGAARLPLVLGNDFAGIVTAVGRGVSGLREGDAVFGARPPSSAGTHATHVLVQARHAVLQPAGQSHVRLAAMPYNFLTVWRALADAGVAAANISGRRVLVHGATGGLGLLAVHLLSQWGAIVTAVGGGDSLALCRAAGAEAVLDRHGSPLSALPRHFAASFNFANWDDDALLLRCLADGAIGHATTVHPMLGNIDRFGLLRGTLANMAQKRRMRTIAPPGARYAWTVFAPDRDALRFLADIAHALPVTATTQFPLAGAAEAHRHVESRRGRAVLLPVSASA
jgi:NADPH:quinone reductase-like Zn-dependent oxidoreductase